MHVRLIRFVCNRFYYLEHNVETLPINITTLFLLCYYST